jgi:hypothetical protein
MIDIESIKKFRSCFYLIIGFTFDSRARLHILVDSRELNGHGFSVQSILMGNLSLRNHYLLSLHFIMVF